MAKFRTCRACGANIDHGESCDCRDRPKEGDNFYPVGGEPKNGFYPVKRGTGTYIYRDGRIVPRETRAAL
jgi:hypothetical protein